MALIFFKKEPECFICHNNVSELTSLPCGHIFCRLCITRHLDAQEDYEIYSCPECWTQYEETPVLDRIKNAAAKEVEQKVSCTFCDDPVPAEKTCVQCETSFCAEHLMKHSRIVGHILIEPTESLEDHKCSKHQEMLKYYCTVDKISICMSCRDSKDHKGHRVRLVEEYAKKRKEKVDKFIKELKAERNEIRSQQSDQNKEEIKYNFIKLGICKITNLKKELDVLEKKLFNRASHLFDDYINRLKTQEGEISETISRVKELYNVTNPLTFLKKERDGAATLGYTPNPVAINEVQFSQNVHSDIFQFAEQVNQIIKKEPPKMKKIKILFDPETAFYYILLSINLRKASYSTKRQSKVIGPKRFQSRHVLSKQSFSSGNHYWEVAVTGTQCRFGVAYSSIERKTRRCSACIGNNRHSWSLGMEDNSVWHHDRKMEISTDPTVKSFGIFLEYDAGRLTFYQLCDPIRHLHTFTNTFTEPLHAAFYLDKGSSITIQT